MTLSDVEARPAEERTRERLKKGPRAIAARYDRRNARLIVSLSNRLELSLPVDLVQGIAGAKAADLAHIEISPTGLRLHWPRLDAELDLPALLASQFGSPRWTTSL